MMTGNSRIGAGLLVGLVLLAVGILIGRSFRPAGAGTDAVAVSTAKNAQTNTPAKPAAAVPKNFFELRREYDDKTRRTDF